MPAALYILLGIVVSLVLLLKLRDWLEFRLIYVPERELRTLPPHVGLEAEDVWFESSDGEKLHGWWFPCEQARGSVIICHGNKGNMGGRLWMAEDFLQWKLNALLFDYRGYGRSSGRASAEGTRLDVLAAHQAILEKTAGSPPLPLLCFGRSLGGAVALQLAAERPVDGLIVESTFTSTLEMGNRFHPWLLPQYTLRNVYDNLSKVSGLTMPKIFAHGREDQKIPFDMGETLFAHAAGPKEFVELVGSHVASNWRTTPAYHHAISNFLDQLSGNPVSTAMRKNDHE